jgi:hypothetical protein
MSTSNIANLVNIARNMGFEWDRFLTRITFDQQKWNVNVVLIDADGFRKPVYGFMIFDSVDDALAAKLEMGI